MISFIFDRLIDPLGLPLPAWQEYVLLCIIGAIAFVIAYVKTGDLYKSGHIHTRSEGSLVHWGLRLLYFIPIWAVTYVVIAVGKVVYHHPLEVTAVAFVMFVVCYAVWDMHRKKADNA